MGLVSDIRDEAVKKRVHVNTSENIEMEKLFNNLFYLEKDIKGELQFLKSVMTRGAESQERKGMHASEIIKSDNDFCMRKQVLSLFYKQIQGHNVEAGLKRIFEEGNAIHEKWQRLFVRAGWASYKELDFTEFVDEYDLQYTPDAIITIPKEAVEDSNALCSNQFAGTYVVEVKSVNTYSFKKMSSHPSGTKQCLFYMYLKGIKKGIVLCEDKNTQEFKVFKYELDAQKIMPYIKRLEDVQYYKKRLLKKGIMVKKHAGCALNNKMYNSCQMHDACYGTGKGKELLDV